MRHRSFHLLSSIAFVLSLLGCTLSTEDWIVTEENKGYDEIITEQNELYTLSYQYKNTTRSLTDSIQQYIVRVDEDSTLYFLDTLPTDWVPKAGGCVVANCCERFPEGFICRVDEVEHIAGMYRVRVSQAAIDEAYDEFNFDMESNIVGYNDDDAESDSINSIIPDVIDPQASEANARRVRHKSQILTRTDANNEKENVKIDWKMFDMVNKEHRRNILTRAIEDDYEEDVDSIKDSIVAKEILSLDGNSIVGQTVRRKTKGVINQFNASISYLNKVHMKKKVVLSKRYELTETTESKGVRLKLLIGHDFPSAKKKEIKDEDLQEIRTKVWQYVRNNYDVLAPSKGFNCLVDDDQGKDAKHTLVIPLSGCPFGFFLRIKPVFSYNLSICGSGSVDIWMSSSYQRSEIEDGKPTKNCTPEPRPAKTPPCKFDYSLFGQAGVSGGLDVTLGYGTVLSNKSAAGVGVFAEGTINISATLAPRFENENWLSDASCCISLHGNLKVGARIMASFWGDFDLGSKNFDLGGWDWPLYPQVVWTTEPKGFDGTNSKDGDYIDYKISYKFSDIGIIYSLAGLKKDYTPGLAIYKPDASGDNLTFVTCIANDGKSKVKKDKVYSFKYRTNDKSSTFIVRPALMYQNESKATILQDYKETFSPSDQLPKVKYYMEKPMRGSLYNTLLVQTECRRCTHADPGMAIYADPGKYRYYKFCLAFHMYNAVKARTYWKDFGIHYTIKGNNIKDVDRYYSLKGKVRRSTDYMPEIAFMTTASTAVQVSACFYYVPLIGDKPIELWGEYEPARDYMVQDYRMSSQGASALSVLLDYNLALDGIIPAGDDYLDIKLPEWIEDLIYRNKCFTIDNSSVAY